MPGNPQGSWRHSREFFEYSIDVQPNGNILLLIDTLMGHIDIVAQNLPTPTTEAEKNEHMFYSFMLQMGQNMAAEQYQRWALEVWLTRCVDAFQYYLSQILLRIYTARPEILKASDNQVDVREVLEAGSIEEFIHQYAEQKVSALSYKGLPEIIKYLNKSLKVGFDMENPDFRASCEIVAVRNIIVHNRGRVNKIFLNRLPQKAREGLQMGERYPLNFKYAVDANNHLQRFAEALDLQIVEHFKFEPYKG